MKKKCIDVLPYTIEIPIVFANKSLNLSHFSHQYALLDGNTDIGIFHFLFLFYNIYLYTGNKIIHCDPESTERPEDRIISIKIR